MASLAKANPTVSPRAIAEYRFSDSDLLDRLPVGVYACDTEGRIIRCNQAAANLWGRSPAIDAQDSLFCGSYRLHKPDGTSLPHADSPMARALATGRALKNERVVIERADGSLTTAQIDIDIIADAFGATTGAVGVFREVPPGATVTAFSAAPERELEDVLQLLPAAIYITDAEGRIVFYNEAAVRLWGVRPEIGKSEFCGSWKLFWPDGSSLPHNECPMAMALRERRAIEGMEAVAERPDGVRVPFLAYPTPLFDRFGALAGAVNMLVDISGRKAAELAAQRLAAIVESSDDAIVAKDLNGVITSWNKGAERLFGYTPEEVLCKPVTILIPIERHDEEPMILSRIRRGEHIDHYETVRRRKDGSLVDISLSVSPISDHRGKVIGASKIARDISDRKRADLQKGLLLREMNHRVKNLFALAGGLLRLSARSADSIDGLVEAMQERFAALARAHALTLPDPAKEESSADRSTTLHTLIGTVLSPYRESGGDPGSRIAVSGIDAPVAGSAITGFALLLHEFATNAAKYGALADNGGCVQVDIAAGGDNVVLTWRESGLGSGGKDKRAEGFGTELTRATVTKSLGGEFTRELCEDGLLIKVSVPWSRLSEG